MKPTINFTCISATLLILIVGLSFSCKPRNYIPDKLTFDFKPILDTAKLEIVSVGDLYLPTGRIVAGDPFFIGNQKPFTIEVKRGSYPVKLLITKISQAHHRIAFAKIQFSETPATHWTLALTSDITDEQIENLKKGDFFGYGVDAGLGCFTDAETNSIYNKTMEKFEKENPGKNYYDNLLEKEFRDVSGQNSLSRKDGDWNNHFPIKNQMNNVIMFASGWGDGSYPTYWGTDSDGNIVELMTDFLVITEQQ